MRGIHMVSIMEIKEKKEHLNYAKHKQGPPPSSPKAKANARAPAADLPQFPFLLNEKFVVCKGTRLLHFPPCGLCTFLQMMELRTYILDSSSFFQQGDGFTLVPWGYMCPTVCLHSVPHAYILLVHTSTHASSQS